MTTTKTTSASASLKLTEASCIFFEFVAFFANLIIASMLTNHMSAEAYGIATLGVTTLTLATPLLLGGANNALFNFFTAYLQASETKASAYLSWCMRREIFGTAVYMIILALLYFYMLLFNHAWLHSDYRYILYFSAIAPLAALISLQSKVLLSVKKYTSYLICFTIIQPVLFIVALLLVWKFSHLTLATVFYAILISYVLGILYGALNMRMIKQRKGILAIVKVSPDTTDTAVWRLSSLKLFGLNELYYVVNNAPIYLIALVATTASASGRYNVMLTVSNLILCLHMAFVTILTPNISTNISTAAGRKKLQALLVTLNRCLLIFGGLLLAFICVFSHDILQFFGKGYEDLAFALVAYSALLFFKSFFSNSYYILEYSDKTQINMIGFLVLLLLTATVGVYFGHLYAVTGMIIAVGISQVLINLYYWAYTKIKLKVNACALW